MAMSKESAIATVAKLLNLAENKSANPNEAAVAAAQAQRIMEQHNLEASMIANERAGDVVRNDESVENFDGHDGAHTPLWVGGKLITWRVALASGLARINDCRVVLTPGLGRCAILIVGTPTDVSVVRYVFTFVSREIDRLGKRAARRGEIFGRTGGNNFRLGAVETVLQNVSEQKRAARSAFVQEHGRAVGNAAIVRLDEKALATKEAFARFYPKLGTHYGGHAERDFGARDAGRRAGRSIAVRTGLNAGSSKGTRLLK